MGPEEQSPAGGRQTLHLIPTQPETGRHMPDAQARYPRPEAGRSILNGGPGDQPEAPRHEVHGRLVLNGAADIVAKITPSSEDFHIHVLGSVRPKGGPGGGFGPEGSLEFICKRTVLDAKGEGAVL